MKRVVHFGPCRSPGGMSTVIQNLVDNPPPGWVAEEVSTHAESPLKMLREWHSAKKDLKFRIKAGRVDIAHIHVTHGLSWYRKRDIMRTCEKFNIPTVIHIHSGKFDKFCSGRVGKSVKRELSIPGRKTILLERRWVGMLSEWVPSSAVVIPNISKPIGDRSKHSLGGAVRLLVLGRNSPVKRHDFCIEILERLDRSGIRAILSMTGLGENEVVENSDLDIRCLGWVGEDRKAELISESDFLLSPSKYEGSSMSIIESMTSGLPCLVSKASKETVGIGSLVMDNDPETWSKAIIGFLEASSYTKLTSEILEEAKKYSPIRNQSKMGEIYDSLAN